MSISLIHYDDTNPDIQYEGNWRLVSVTPAMNNFGDSGPTLNNTLHVATGVARFLYPFRSDSEIRVFGTSNNNRSVPPPKITCKVDGIDINTDSGWGVQQNDHLYCWNTDLELSPTEDHVLEFTAEIPEGQEFMLDSLFTAPLSKGDSNLENAFLRVTGEGDMITYQGTWATFEMKELTTVNGSKAIIDFSGRIATAEWSLDGGPKTRFTFPKKSNPGRLYDELVFTVGPIPSAQHRLEVTYLSQDAAPLCLQYLMIETAPDPNKQRPTLTGSWATGTTGLGTVPTGQTSSPSVPSGKWYYNQYLRPIQSTGLSTGAKAGIGAGFGAAFLLLLALGYLLWKARRHRSTIYVDQEDIVPTPTPPRPLTAADPYLVNRPTLAGISKESSTHVATTTASSSLDLQTPAVTSPARNSLFSMFWFRRDLIRRPPAGAPNVKARSDAPPAYTAF
ncbi:hypothetical protein CVT24_009611 [Panaeolus cyanescens]|uniref:Uncharacterized protein n=1 Tax=Panaeolus cyanescens TaxID=181874 RepID=A0A409YA32_9AGAR|nr:hypothetical protein CVT24_009611 [Panaeolus cyanescens]